MVTQSSNLTFLRPGSGEKLFASAKEINRGKSTGVYDIRVTNEQGKLVACGQIIGFATGRPLVEE